MNLDDLNHIVEKRKARKRVGRGPGSGIGGHQAAVGEKGAKSRAGFSHQYYMEGGQMPLQRRLPKRGFSNAAFKVRYEVVNLDSLSELFPAGSRVGPKELAEKGLVKPDRPVKLLGRGQLAHALELTAHRASAQAQAAIQAAGGTFTQLPTRKDMWEQKHIEKTRERRRARAERAKKRTAG